ncbi:hypothetical protein HYQ46_013237 [Verticillium longisporum]|nr:hypothetical protein HYQ46_013237 [Verticillium longisporum]
MLCVIWGQHGPHQGDGLLVIPNRKGVDVLTEYVTKLLHQSRRSAGYARPRPGRIVRCGIRGVFKGERGLSGTLCI